MSRIMRAARADQDALLGLGLDPDRGAHGEQAVLALLDLLDLDLDGVRDLLAGAAQHLLADELGEEDLLAQVGDLVLGEVERALREQGDEVVDERRDARRPCARTTGKISASTSPSSAAACSALDDLRPAEAVDLVERRSVTGAFAPASACAMKRSPGPPTPCAPSTHEQHGVGLRQLRLDAPLHARGQHVARALHAGQVAQHRLPVAGAGGDAADRAARRLRLVGDDRDLAADDRVDQRRLADVRPPRQRDEPGPRRSPRQPSPDPAARASRRRRSRGPSRRRCSTPWTTASSRSVVCSGQITTSPSSRGPSGRRRASSTGNDSTSVGPCLAAVLAR